MNKASDPIWQLGLEAARAPAQQVHQIEPGITGNHGESNATHYAARRPFAKVSARFSLIGSRLPKPRFPIRKCRQNP